MQRLLALRVSENSKIWPDVRGAVFAEKLIAYLPLLVSFFLAWELAEVSAASLVVQRASAAAGRAAMVVLPDDPAFYDGEPAHSFGGMRRDDVELAAGMVLSSLPQLSSDFVVDVSAPPADSGSIDVTVTAFYQCGAAALLCGLDGSMELSSTTTHAYHGARYAYSSAGGSLGGASQGLTQSPGAGYRKGNKGGGNSGQGGGNNHAGTSTSTCDPDCPSGADALLNATGGGSMLDLASATHKSSREAREGVYIARGKVRKVYTSEQQAQEALNELRSVRATGIQVPGGLRLVRGKKRVGNRCKDVWILEKDEASGRFFQLAKGNKALLNDARVADTATLKRVVRQLLLAWCRGVTDPQGFFDASKNPPLTFIDVHTQSGNNGRGSESLSSTAQALNDELERRGAGRVEIDCNE